MALPNAIEALNRVITVLATDSAEIKIRMKKAWTGVYGQSNGVRPLHVAVTDWLPGAWTRRCRRCHQQKSAISQRATA